MKWTHEVKIGCCSLCGADVRLAMRLADGLIEKRACPTPCIRYWKDLPSQKRGERDDGIEEFPPGHPQHERLFRRILSLLNHDDRVPDTFRMWLNMWISRKKLKEMLIAERMMGARQNVAEMVGYVLAGSMHSTQSIQMHAYSPDDYYTTRRCHVCYAIKRLGERVPARNQNSIHAITVYKSHHLDNCPGGCKGSGRVLVYVNRSQEEVWENVKCDKMPKGDV